MSSLEFDIVITNAQVLTMNSKMEIFDKGYILIKESEIVEIGNMKDFNKNNGRKIDSVENINANNNIVIPGFVNAHGHFAMSLLRGIADDLPLKKWLTEYIWPLESNLTKDDCYIGTKLAIIEMIQSGTTTACDMYFFEKDVMKAVEEIGFRGVLGHGMIDLGNEEKMNEEVKQTKELINYSKSNSNLSSIIISPHAPDTCSPELLSKAKALSEKNNLPLQIHLAETMNEVTTIKEKYGVTPTKYLDNLNFLSDKLVAAHCIWIEDDDIRILKEKGVNIAHNPTSNLKLGSGIFNYKKFSNNKLTIALGTDGPSSNNNLSMIEELRMASYTHKGFNKDPVILPASEALRMATINGAKSLGLSSITGSLEIGKKADIVILDKKRPNVYPPHDPYSMIAYSMNESNVETTIINGKIKLRNRKFIEIDVSAILEESKEAIGNLIDKSNLEQFNEKRIFLN